MGVVNNILRVSQLHFCNSMAVNYVHILCGQTSGSLLGHLMLGYAPLVTFYTPLGLVFGPLVYLTFMFWKILIIEGPLSQDGPGNLGVGYRCIQFGFVIGFCMVLAAHYTMFVAISLCVLVLAWIALFIAVRFG